MKDRIVEHPKRFRLVKVEDQLAQYDLIAAPGEITEIGTPINKSTLLQDETFDQYTNTESTKSIEATPNGVFRALSRANATSIVTILANSNEFKNKTPGSDPLASFDNIIYDATGKCTQDKVYIPKGIKKVRISASFYFSSNQDVAVTVDICKNGSPVQSLYLKTREFTEEGAETAECVIDTAGNGTEYLQIKFGELGSARPGHTFISCYYAVFQMLTY